MLLGIFSVLRATNKNKNVEEKYDESKHLCNKCYKQEKLFIRFLYNVRFTFIHNHLIERYIINNKWKTYNSA